MSAAEHSEAADQPRPRPRRGRQATVVALIVFVIVVLRHAWMMDDAYITVRVVDNLFAGHGLVWNRGERVWAYTHPLWLLILVIARTITRESFYTLLMLGTILSVASLALVTVKLSRAQLVGASLVVCATLSHAFVDYSTSGLENPLSHLLIALSAWAYLGRVPSVSRFGMLCMLGGFALLCRPDNALVLGPLVLAAGFQAWRRGATMAELVRTAAIAGMPVWIWELFALIYYGALIPNTALAKLNTGIDRGELVSQGMFYLIATLDHDPVTLVIICAGVCVPIATRDRRTLPFVAGIGLSLIYTVLIGGDFMLGRLLCAPMFLALICLSQVRRVGLAPLAVSTFTVVALGLAIEPNTLEISSMNSRAEPEARTRWRITDERALLYQGAGLVHASRNVQMPSHRWTKLGLRGTRSGGRSEVARALGFMAQAGDPGIHWIDDVGLCDPLLARLPAVYDPQWMHGHFVRAIPPGYEATVETGENQLEDPALRELYDRLDRVSHGPVFSGERLAAIVWLNTGGPRRLIDAEAWRFHGAAQLEPEAIASTRVADGTSLRSRRAHPFPTPGVLVTYPERQHHGEVEVSVNDDDRFELRFYDDSDGGEEIGRVPIPRALSWSATGLIARRVALPTRVRERGFTRLRLLPLTQERTEGPIYALGHLLFDEAIEATGSSRPSAPERPTPPPEAAPEHTPPTPPQ